MMPLLLLSALSLLPTAGGSGASQTPAWIAHRGVHQVIQLQGVEADTCTADRILPPTHTHLENTLESVQAALEAGAQKVEVDLQRSADGHVVLFHDADLSCRTDGSGPVAEHTLSALQALDLGYGYTADGGQSFPLRGAPQRMPTLEALLETFPEAAFVFHLKSSDPQVGLDLARALEGAENPHWVYGHPRSVAAFTEQAPHIPTLDKPRLKACLKEAARTPLQATLPSTCDGSWILLPAPWTRLIPGGPRRFFKRAERSGVPVVLAGPLVDGNGTGVDSPRDLRRVPRSFQGWLWTNRVEEMAPPR